LQYPDRIGFFQDVNLTAPAFSTGHVLLLFLQSMKLPDGMALLSFLLRYKGVFKGTGEDLFLEMDGDEVALSV
jgi:hypothetical protein